MDKDLKKVLSDGSSIESIDERFTGYKLFPNDKGRMGADELTDMDYYVIPGLQRSEDANRDEKDNTPERKR